MYFCFNCCTKSVPASSAGVSSTSPSCAWSAIVSSAAGATSSVESAVAARLSPSCAETNVAKPIVIIAATSKELITFFMFSKINFIVF